MIPELEIKNIENLGFTISITPKTVTKYWCWAYKTEEVALYVKEKIIERWTDCPVQKFEDYTKVFVPSSEKIMTTNIEITEIGKDWTLEGIVIKDISGKI